MACTIMSTGAVERGRAGFTLTELVVASAIASLVALAAVAAMSHSAIGFSALAHYADLDRRSRHALDLLGTEIRQADTLLAYAPNRIVLKTTNPVSKATGIVVYTYDADLRTLTRSLQGTPSETSTLLVECDSLRFSIFQRNSMSGKYDQYPSEGARPDLCKLVQVSWKCSRRSLNGQVNTEDVQSAKFVIRKQ